MRTSARLFLALLVPLAAITLASCAARPTHYDGLVREGSVDLRSLPFDEGTSLRLNGQWRFWEGELVSPAEARDRIAKGEGSFMKVPGFWSKLGSFESAAKLSSRGSLALEILLPAGDREWALRLPDSYSACALYADEERIARIGSLSTDPAGYIPGKRVETASFRSRGGKVLILLQIENYSTPQTGTWDSPSLGILRGIQNERMDATVVDSIVSGAMLFMGLYHLALFLVRRKDRSALVFALICIFMSVRELIMGERILMALFPATQAGWQAAFAIEHLSAHMCVGLFFVFFRLIFPEEMPKWAVAAALAVCGLWAGLEILTPPLVCHRFLPWFEYFILAASLFVVAVIARAVAKRREGAAIILSGLILLILTALNDVLLSNGVIEGMYAASFGMFLFTLSQGIYLARRSARLFSAVESYVAELEKVNTSLERFIPKEMLTFLGKTSIVEVGLGNYIEARMSVLFLDIRGFTARSEGMSPDENFRFINSFLEDFGPLVRKHGGFIDKYLGDGFMALFPGDADAALNSALAMRGELAAFNARLAGLGQPALAFGIGIHSGPLMLGTIGENLRMDTTVISDTVNTASRLEELNKEFGTDILVSEETRLALSRPELFRTRLLAERQVKGKARLIKVYLLEGEL